MLVPVFDMGVTAFAQDDRIREDKNDPFHLLIDLKYHTIWKEVQFSVEWTLWKS